MTDSEFNDIANNDAFGVPVRNDNNIIMAIGVGGGGSNAVRHMYEQKIDGVTFAITNTDRQALMNSPVPNRVLLGSGLGAGGEVQVARAAAEESADAIKKLFNKDIRMVFITAGMGGGTGTGAGPVVARLAREEGLLTIGIVTIPFLFEGDTKILKALDGAEEMGKYVDALLMINNQRLSEIYPDLNFLNAFDKADDTLSIAARSISDIITIEGKINRDFNDVNTTLRNGGTAIISTGYGEGEDRVSKAIEDALHSPLLKNSDIYGSKRLLFVIYFSPDAEQEFKMSEADQLTAFTSSIDPGVEIIWGVYPDKSLGEKVKITILASGFKATIKSNFHPKTDTTPDNNTAVVAGDKTVLEPVVTDTAKAETKPDSAKDGEQAARRRLMEQYGADVIYGQQREKARKRQVILSPDQFDNDAIIDALEKSVAYKRERRAVEDIQAIKSTPRQPAAQQDDRSQAAGDLNENKGNVITF
ncbi:MAG: cell division FtsZ family protein [Muribaculaceae bacterium]|nr:cell division FtsZ family protein [Muribaculaceae bacterium]